MRRILLVLLALGLFVGLTGCGDDGSEGTSGDEKSSSEDDRDDDDASGDDPCVLSKEELAAVLKGLEVTSVKGYPDPGGGLREFCQYDGPYSPSGTDSGHEARVTIGSYVEAAEGKERYDGIAEEGRNYPDGVVSSDDIAMTKTDDGTYIYAEFVDEKSLAKGENQAVRVVRALAEKLS